MSSTRILLSITFAASIVLARGALADCGWLRDGFPVAPSQNEESDPVIAPDGAGGAFILWQDYRNGTEKIYAQHLDANGVRVQGWPSGGLAVSIGVEYDPMIVADGRGGVFFSVADGRYAGLRHIGPDGTLSSIASPLSFAVRRSAPGSAQSPTEIEKTDPTGLTSLIPDGSGGVFVAWEFGGHLRTNVVLQRFTSDALAAPGWDNPTMVTGYPDGHAPVMCSDGGGGVIIAWNGYVNNAAGVVVAHSRGDSSAAPLWRAGSAVASSKDAPGIVPDGAGGAIVVWQDMRNASYEQVFAQRFTATGAIAAGWPAEDLPVCTFPTSPGLTRWSGGGRTQRYSAVAPDGAGGVLMVWRDERANDGDIYAQHLLPDGTLAPGWPVNGLPICTAPGIQNSPSITPDGAGGAFIAWEDSRSGGRGVYGQHISGSGVITPGWPENGVAIGTGPDSHYLPRFAPDGAGGAILVWQDVLGSSTQVDASHVAADGSLSTANADSFRAATLLSSAADSGFVRLAWQIMNPDGADATVYCRHVDGPWMAVARVRPDPGGIATYSDVGAIAGCRYGYALGVTTCQVEHLYGEIWVDIPDGHGFLPLSISRQSVVADAGSVTLDWQVSEAEGLSATVFRSDSCSSWSELGSASFDDTGHVSFVDRTPAFEDRRVEYRLDVHGCGKTFSFDGLSTVIPEGRGFVATQVLLQSWLVGPSSIDLAWKIVSGPECVGNVYRQDSTSAWQLRATVVPHSEYVRYLDSNLLPGTRYVYRLSLSSCGIERLFDPVVMQTAPGPPAPRFDLALAGARPNPARAPLSVSFTLTGSGLAQLELFDATGRLVMRRDLTALGPGDHTLMLGAEERALSPGFYLVRLTEAGRSLTSRIVLR